MPLYRLSKLQNKIFVVHFFFDFDHSFENSNKQISSRGSLIGFFWDRLLFINQKE
jgi:hypothetical protein